MTKLTCPEFLELDQELIEEFMACYHDAHDEIEHCIRTLRSSPDAASINTLFRAMHSLKGNCRMVYLDPFVESLHSLEEIVSDLREQKAEYQPELGDFMLACTESFFDQIQYLLNHRCVDPKPLALVNDWVARVHKASGNHPEQIARRGTAALRGETALPSVQPTLPPILPDLELMQMMSQKLDALSIYRRGRLDQLMELADLLNDALNNPIHRDQLHAAVYMHDIGMAFVPHGIFNKEGSLSREEQRMIQTHVDIGYQILRRMSGWDEAAIMVLHHHERYDGEGYPGRLSGKDIHIGGRVLSLVDTYCSITNERSDRNFRKSLLSAVTEINSNRALQFDPELVDVFNEVVRVRLLRRTA